MSRALAPTAHTSYETTLEPTFRALALSAQINPETNAQELYVVKITGPAVHLGSFELSEINQ